MLTRGAWGSAVFTVGPVLPLHMGALREGLELQGRWEWRREGSGSPHSLAPLSRPGWATPVPLLLVWRARASSTTAAMPRGLCARVRVRGPCATECEHECVMHVFEVWKEIFRLRSEQTCVLEGIGLLRVCIVVTSSVAVTPLCQA